MNYKTSKKIIFRVIKDELIVIQIDTGHYYYFNKETEHFLEYFKEGATLESYVSFYQLDLSETHRLEAFCDELLERKIFEKYFTLNGRAFVPENVYVSPLFLREGEKTLDQISFASP